ncbi:MAG: hypothetical protein NZ524_00805 [Thiobacillaceae bacterium]|nr:hypothetical protein [Thiobacillaceae bacterium]MDW8323113.1 protein YgfX [Burkholderiales bacterium]
MTPYPLVLRLRPSRIARLFLTGVAIAALAAALLADLPWGARGLAAVMVALVLWRGWRMSLPVALRLSEDGRLQWRQAGQDWQEATLLAACRATPWLCVLACRTAGGRRDWAVFPDSLPADDFRRLRVWLRWQARLEPERLPLHFRRAAAGLRARREPVASAPQPRR